MAGMLARLDIRQFGRPILTALLVWLVLNVGFLMLFVRPRGNELATLETDSQPRLQKLAERKQQVEQREAFLAALQKAEADLESLRGEWLGTRGRHMVPIQLELSRLAEQFNINMDNVRYQNSELDDEGLERFAMVVPLEAGYSNLRRFLQAVETSNRFLVVERVALGQGKEGGVMLELNITLATYFDAPHLKKRKEEEERRKRQEQRARARQGRT